MSKIFKPRIVMPPVPPAPEPVRFEPPEPKETTADADAAAKLEEDGAKEGGGGGEGRRGGRGGAGRHARRRWRGRR